MDAQSRELLENLIHNVIRDLLPTKDVFFEWTGGALGWTIGLPKGKLSYVTVFSQDVTLERATEIYIKIEIPKGRENEPWIRAISEKLLTEVHTGGKLESLRDKLVLPIQVSVF